MNRVTATSVALVMALGLSSLALSCGRTTGVPPEENAVEQMYQLREVPYGSWGPETPPSPFSTPFSPTWGVSFTLEECQPVGVDLYDVEGELAAGLFDSTVCRGGWRLVPTAGWKVVTDSLQQEDTVLVRISDLEEGVYFFRTTIGSKTATHRVLLIR